MANHKSDATWHPHHEPPKHRPPRWTAANVGRWLAIIFCIWFAGMVIVLTTIGLLKEAL